MKERTPIVRASERYHEYAYMMHNGVLYRELRAYHAHASVPSYYYTVDNPSLMWLKRGKL